jgi:uncharacterized membrane protein
MSDLHVTDKNIERTVANLLRAGVILSGTVVAIGGAIYLLRHGGDISDYHAFKKLPEADRLVPDIVGGALHHRARSIIQVGVLLLIMTPTARVAVSLVGFALERDHKYVVITAIVLCVLLYSLISGALGLA